MGIILLAVGSLYLFWPAGQKPSEELAVRREPGDIVALFRGTVYKTDKPFFKDPA